MPYRPFDQNCSIARTLEIVGERWTLLVLRDVSLGVHRFEEFQRRLGIATNVLTDRLQTLVDRGVLKKVPTERPDRFEYRFTRKGASLSPVITSMMHWGDTWEAPDGPPRLIVHTACGSETHAVSTCAHCGEPLEPHEIETKPGPGAKPEQGPVAIRA